MSPNLAPEYAAPIALRCPKCAGEMVSGIHVDQCRESRGIFLDRCEFERLVDAESNGASFAGPAMNPPAPIPLPLTRTPRDDPRFDQRTDQGDGYRLGWFGGDDDDGIRGRRLVDAESNGASWAGPAMNAPEHSRPAGGPGRVTDRSVAHPAGRSLMPSASPRPATHRGRRSGW